MGKDFWLGFMENHPYPSEVKLIISSPKTANGSVYINNTLKQTFTVNPYSSETITIPYSDVGVNTSELIENKGIHVTADELVSVYAFTYKEDKSTEAAVVFPTPALGIQYVVTAYTPEKNYKGKSSEFLVVATENNTKVTINPSYETFMGQPAGVPFDITLHSGDVYQVQAKGTVPMGEGDLTGSIVESDKPIAVYAGNKFGLVPYEGFWFPNHLYEQMLPVHTWGRKYFTLPFVGRRNNSYRIVAANDNTTVYYNGNEVATLNTGEFYEILSYESDPVYFEGSKPISVSHLGNSGAIDATGHVSAFMMMLTPVEQMVEEVSFEVLNTDLIYSSHYYLQIFTKTINVPLIELDNNDISGKFTAIPGTEFSYARFNISKGTHHLISHNPDEGFAAYVYGYGGYHHSLGYPVGIALNPLFDVADKELICEGSSIQLDAGRFFKDYKWSTGATTRKESITKAGNYWVEATSWNNCPLHDDFEIVVSSKPTVNFASTATICDGEVISLDAGSGHAAYKWYNGSTNRYLKVASARTYSVEVTNSDNCSEEYEMELTVNPTPKIESQNFQNITCCDASDASIEVEVTDGTPKYSFKLSNGKAQDCGIFTNLSEGSYSVEITDTKGCSVSTPVYEITNPEELKLEETHKNVSYPHGNDGKITLSATGGEPPYLFALDNGSFQSDNTFEKLNAGNYTLTVKDKRGCEKSVNVLINEPAELKVHVKSEKTSCNGVKDGKINASATGGTTPYKFSINGINFYNDGSFGSLNAGEYTVTVKDATGYTKTKTIEVSQPLVLQLSAVVKDVTCHNGSDGNMLATVSGGTPPYNYSIDDKDYYPKNRFNYLKAGTYSIYLKDANNCKKSIEKTIEQPEIMVISTTVQDVSCNQGSDGHIKIEAEGETPPYKYSLDGIDYQFGNTFGQVKAGTYNLHVKDVNNCISKKELIVEQPDELQLTEIHENITCYGSQTGSINLTAKGGTLPYSFAINSNDYQPTGDFNKLKAGRYTLHVKDAHNCSVQKHTELSQPDDLVITSINGENIDCYGGSNGKITIEATGGVTPYSFSVKTDVFQDKNKFSNLTAQDYKITVKDANQCVVNGAITLTSPESMDISETHQDVSCNSGSDATIELSVSGGQTPHQFSLNDIDYQTSNRFENLVAKTYTATIKDNNNCKQTIDITIDQPTKLLFSTNVTDVDCYGNNTGIISANATGGTAPYQYKIDNNGFNTSNIFNQLKADTYIINVQDANHCVFRQKIAVAQPDLLVAQASPGHVKCFSGSDGKIEISASGGTNPYQYALDEQIYHNDNLFDNLKAGDFTVYVKDSHGCVASDNTIITQPEKLEMDANGYDASCYQKSDGKIEISAKQGTAPYLFTIKEISKTNTNGVFKGLYADTYTLITLDAHSCRDSMHIEIDHPSPLKIAATHTDVSCHSGSDGEVSLQISGSKPPYFYSMNAGYYAGQNQFTGLNKGIYSFLVVDNHFCTIDTVITIDQPDALQLSTTPKHINCYGDNAGEISATANGGTPPYSYAVDDEQYTSSDIFTELFAGEYKIKLRDANNCLLSTSVSIAQPTELNAVVETNNISCNKGSNGVIRLLVTGGSPNYQYALDDNTFQQDSVFKDLTADTYVVTYKDKYNCKKHVEIELIEPEKLVLSHETVDISCNSFSDGVIKCTATGGTKPYQYAIHTPDFNEDSIFTHLPIGKYPVYVTDANNCRDSLNATLNQPNKLEATTSTKDVNCHSGSDGEITVEATGGTTPYQYFINKSKTPSSLKSFTSLNAGNYIIDIVDKNNCSVSLDVIINEPSDISYAIDKKHVTCYDGEDGAIIVNTSGGVAPYQYRLNNGSFLNKNSFRNLIAGNYSLAIKDAHNCMKTDKVAITEPMQWNVKTISKNIDCYGNKTGSITIEVENTEDSIFYSINNIDFQKTNTFNHLGAGDYKITVKNHNNCTEYTEACLLQPEQLKVKPAVSPTNCESLENGTIRLDISGGTEPYSILWETGDTTSFMQNLPEGWYSAIVQDANKCAVVDSFMVEVAYDECIDVPSAFSPNNDGINDKWIIRSLQFYPDATVQVYNRHGRCIYTSKGYHTPWNGTVNGGELPAGTYYYSISLKKYAKPITGSVTLVKKMR